MRFESYFHGGGAAAEREIHSRRGSTYSACNAPVYELVRSALWTETHRLGTSNTSTSPQKADDEVTFTKLSGEGGGLTLFYAAHASGLGPQYFLAQLSCDIRSKSAPLAMLQSVVASENPRRCDTADATSTRGEGSLDILENVDSVDKGSECDDPIWLEGIVSSVVCHHPGSHVYLDPSTSKITPDTLLVCLSALGIDVNRV